MEEKHPKLNLFLKKAAGVIHVGASTGQERDLYGKNRKVLWIEPIPEVYEQLKRNLKGYALHSSIQALIAATSGTKTLWISSNNGESSSVYPLKDHKKLHNRIGYTSSIEVRAFPLDDLALMLDGYDALVLDVQGSELEVLKGGEETLKKMRFIKTEAWSIEAYERIPMRGEIEAFLQCRGFRLIHEEPYYGGKGWDLVFEKK